MNQNQQDIDELLLLQYLRGNADESLRARVDEWLNADSGNRRNLDQLESLWLETGRISPVPVAVDADEAWNRMVLRLNGVEKPGGRVRNIGNSRILWAVAAVVIILAGIFSIYELTKAPKQLHLASFDRVLRDSLPDGSKFTLNLNSTLDYPAEFDNKIREVKLTGEAFFEVKHDSLQPFIVDAGVGKIRVLGTAFSVNVHPVRVVEVSVTQGRVMLFRVDERSGDTISLILLAGESGMMKEGALKPERTVKIAPDGLFWANHSLDFSRTTLAEVFSLLEKYYSLKISVSDPTILDCRLTASFMNEPAEKILTVIAESFGLTLQGRGRNFHLTGHGCNNEDH
jgi:ferric-dicitrate binding protein FerR (iron transport regulator)